MKLFNIQIDIKKVNKETNNILRTLKNVKHQPTKVYKSYNQKSQERKSIINKNILGGFRK